MALRTAPESGRAYLNPTLANPSTDCEFGGRYPVVCLEIGAKTADGCLERRPQTAMGHGLRTGSYPMTC